MRCTDPLIYETVNSIVANALRSCRSGLSTLDTSTRRYKKSWFAHNKKRRIEKVKEHPILFKTEMVKAILDGRKTQTRRIITPQPNNPYIDGDIIRKYLSCRLGEVGDRLWVKETWDSDCTCGSPECTGVIYKAGYDGKIIPDKWRPSIFMPRKYSRITLGITDVKVQRLQDITTEDIIAEGIISTLREHDAEVDLRDKYKVLWDSINFKRGYGWNTNPWVWVITFKKLEANNG
jgi:hypothetical protein